MKRPLQERGSRCGQAEIGKTGSSQVTRNLGSNSGFTTLWLSQFEEIFISILKIK